jgi:hypothetical protein
MSKQPFSALIVKCICARQIGVVKSDPCLAILNINVVKRVRLVAVLYQEEEVISQKLSNYCFLKTLVK